MYKTIFLNKKKVTSINLFNGKHTFFHINYKSIPLDKKFLYLLYILYLTSADIQMKCSD